LDCILLAVQLLANKTTGSYFLDICLSRWLLASWSTYNRKTNHEHYSIEFGFRQPMDVTRNDGILFQVFPKVTFCREHNEVLRASKRKIAGIIVSLLNYIPVQL